MSDHRSEDNFFKGMFFGALVGIGISLFLNSVKGKEILRSVKERLDELVEDEPSFSDSEISSETEVEDLPGTFSGAVGNSKKKRFFKKYKL